ncbi:MAG TPA: hypothetical protein VFL91_08305 [Thermomicrobiales bacterium]|nr:hypothetical protein [Thermomicrobiales bacterium]
MSHDYLPPIPATLRGVRFASRAANYPVHDLWFVQGGRLTMVRCQEVVSGLFYLLNPPDWASERIGLAGISVFVTMEDARQRAQENLLAEVMADLRRLVDELGLPEGEVAELLRRRWRGEDGRWAT